jgi:hypothetical protein
MAIYEIFIHDGEFKDSFHTNFKFENFENKQEILNYISEKEDLNIHNCNYRIDESKKFNGFYIGFMDNNNDYISYLNIYKVESLIKTLAGIGKYDLECSLGWHIKRNFEIKDKKVQFYLESLLNKFGHEKLQKEFPHELLNLDLIISEVNKILKIATIDYEKQMEEYEKQMMEDNEKYSDELAERYHNIQMESADRELRVWDTEDPSWRIANDLD